MFVRAVAGFFQILPEGMARRVGAGMGYVAYAVDLKHRKIALDNLKLAFGDACPDAKRRAIARQNFVNLATNFVAFCRIPLLTENAISRKIRIHGKGYVEEARKEGKGIIFFLSHLGNWEILATAQLVWEYPLYAVGKPIRNPYLDRWIRGIRERFGLKLVSSKGAAKTLLRLLRENQMVAILADQRARRREAVTIDFFGQPAPTLPTPAFFALRTGAAVIPLTYTWEEGVYHITLHPPFDIVRTGDLRQDIVENTQRFHRFLEDEIRKDPAKWFWVHRRWKRKEGRKRRHRKAMSEGNR